MLKKNQAAFWQNDKENGNPDYEIADNKKDQGI